MLRAPSCWLASCGGLLHEFLGVWSCIGHFQCWNLWKTGCGHRSWAEVVVGLSLRSPEWCSLAPLAPLPFLLSWQLWLFCWNQSQLLWDSWPSLPMSFRLSSANPGPVPWCSFHTNYRKSPISDVLLLKRVCHSTVICSPGILFFQPLVTGSEDSWAQFLTLPGTSVLFNTHTLLHS